MPAFIVRTRYYQVRRVYKAYVCQPKSDTLPHLLEESFKLFEMCFSLFDEDGAGTISFSELQDGFAKMGVYGGSVLFDSFNKVDVDRNGTLDFSEFLALMHIWYKQGSAMLQFFCDPINVDVAQRGFALMQAYLAEYDTDGNLRMSEHELDGFFRKMFPEHYRSGAYKEALDDVWPRHTRTTEMGFTRFMYLCYCVCCNLPGSGLQGTYNKKKWQEFKIELGRQVSMNTLAGPEEMKRAFEVLEKDFKQFDKQGEGLTDMVELSVNMSHFSKDERLESLMRLQMAFFEADGSNSKVLDFFEFMHLGFVLTTSGSYSKIITSSDPKVVKKTFLDIHRRYTSEDRDRNKRLTYDELRNFIKRQLGYEPSNLTDVFNQIGYQSSSANYQTAVDMVRLFQLLYILVNPTGQYAPGKYKPNKRGHNMFKSLISAPTPSYIRRPARVPDVNPALFEQHSFLGQDGLEEQMKGAYNGVVCVGRKFSTSSPLISLSAELVGSILNEVRLVEKIEHPNCQYLIGAKTTLENGGILLLVEHCSEGSIFDCYCKGKHFDVPTAWRLAKETASGLEAIHNLGYMHRNINSSNVLLDGNMVAKISSFELCTDERQSDTACGQPRWTAPEVLKNFGHGKSLYDKRCDVYSFGVVLFEIFNGRIPMTSVPNHVVATQVLTRNRRPTNDVAPKEVEKIMERCWDAEPANRPSISEVLSLLEGVKSVCGGR